MFPRVWSVFRLIRVVNWRKFPRKASIFIKPGHSDRHQYVSRIVDAVQTVSRYCRGLGMQIEFNLTPARRIQVTFATTVPGPVTTWFPHRNISHLLLAAVLLMAPRSEKRCPATPARRPGLPPCSSMDTWLLGNEIGVMGTVFVCPLPRCRFNYKWKNDPATTPSPRYSLPH